MKRIKTFLSLILVAAMLTALFPAGAVVNSDDPGTDAPPVVEEPRYPEDAAEQLELTETVTGTCGEKLTWRLSTYGTLTVSGEGEMTNWSWDNTPWYSYRNAITQVIVGDSVTSIGTYAFYRCENLESVTLGSSITSIGDHTFDQCSDLTSITISDSVTSIGDDAFGYCTSLASVGIGDSVTSIGDRAFYSCKSLTSVTLGDSVTSIGDYAFYLCALTSITLPNSVASIGDYAFYYCDFRNLNIPDSVTSIGDHAFRSCVNLASVTFLDSATSIGDSSFSGCTSLVSVALGSGVTGIGDYAFAGCAITSIEIPGSVTAIGDGPFAKCSSLTSIELSANNSGFVVVDGVLFDKEQTRLIQYPAGKSEPSYQIPDTVTTIGGGAFYGCRTYCLFSMVIPDGVTSIGDYAFSDVAWLEDVTLGSNLTSIGAYAFENTNLGSVVIPDSVTTFGAGVFDGCEFLHSVELGNGLTSIPGYVFYNCKSLRDIDIPDGVTSIGERAFYGAPLTEIFLPNSVTSMGSYAFSGTGITVYYTGTEEEWNAISGLNNTALPNAIKYFNVLVSGYKWILHKNGILRFEGYGDFQDYEQGASPWYKYREMVSELLINGNTSHIGAYAFYGFSLLENVVLSDNVTSIGNHAFDGCSSLKTIVLTDKVKSVGDYAFDSATTCYYFGTEEQWAAVSDGAAGEYQVVCYLDFGTCGESLFWILTGSGTLTISGTGKMTDWAYSLAVPWYSHSSSITEVVVEDGVASIGDNAFIGCDLLETVVIPDGVVSIGDKTFEACVSLDNITIPSSVRYIGDLAFYECLSLTTVNFGGSRWQWNAIDMGDENYYLLEADIIFSIEDVVAPVVTVTLNSNDKPVISWTAVDGAEKYEVYRAIGDGEFKLLKTMTSRKLTNTSVEAGKTYRYMVRAIAGEEYSDYSEVITVSIPVALAAPTVTVTLNSNDKPVISWNAVDGAEKYEVWRAVEGGTFKLLKTTTSKKLTNTSVEAGKTYSYKVRAIAGEELGEFSAVVTITVPVTLGVPTVTVTLNSSDKPVISWTAVDGATKYEVWRAVDGGAFKLLKTTTSKKLTNTSVEAGKTYSYKVRAVAGETYSDYSAVKTITVPSALGTPTVTVSNKASTGKVVVKWGKVEGAEKYEIWYSTSKSGTYTRLWIGSSTSVTHSSAKAGTIYYYKVRAVADGEYGEFSEIKQRACDCARPVVTITLSSKGKPVISWNAVDGAVKYEIWCSTSENGTYTKLITTTKLKVTHSSAVSGTTYFYKVRAICSVSSGNSAYSTVKSVTAE